MTSPTNRPRSRSQDPDEPTVVPRSDADADVVDVDATVQRVGTFAAGQSADGRHLAVTAAPKGDFAVGQAEEDEPASDEAKTRRSRPLRDHRAERRVR